MNDASDCEMGCMFTFIWKGEDMEQLKYELMFKLVYFESMQTGKMIFQRALCHI